MSVIKLRCRTFMTSVATGYGSSPIYTAISAVPAARGYKMQPSTSTMSLESVTTRKATSLSAGKICTSSSTVRPTSQTCGSVTVHIGDA